MSTGVTKRTYPGQAVPEVSDPEAREEPIRMERLAAQAAEELADAPAEEIVRWAVDTFGSRICITSSMTDAVIIHLASKVKSGLDVIFLDTGYHFPETIGTRDAVSAVYPVNVVNVTPSRTVAEQDAELGPRLYGRNPDLCCYFRKVVPLERALDPYDAWITGVRREETNARSDTKAVQWDPRRQMVKVNPIVAWTQDQVDAYIAEQGVLVNPLVYMCEGFRAALTTGAHMSLWAVYPAMLGFLALFMWAGLSGFRKRVLS